MPLRDSAVRNICSISNKTAMAWPTNSIGPQTARAPDRSMSTLGACSQKVNSSVSRSAHSFPIASDSGL